MRKPEEFPQSKSFNLPAFWDLNSPPFFLSVRCFGLGLWFKILKSCLNDILLLLLFFLFFVFVCFFAVLPLLGPVLQLIKHKTPDTGFMKWMETIPTVLGYFKKDCFNTV